MTASILIKEKPWALWPGLVGKGPARGSGVNGHCVWLL